MPFPHVFAPLQLRHRTLKSRINFGAHTANMAEGGLPGERHIGYYRERALGGAGMIVVEPVPVHRTAVLTRGNFRHDDDTIIPAFMQKDEVKIGFGIMGGWNQGQAHAQFVSNIVDHGLTLQQALEAGRFTKGTFEGCDVDIEALVPDATRRALTARGHVIRVVEPRTGTFGYGQAVMSGAGGVHFGASEPRHDGAAIPQAPPVFTGSPQP